MTIGGADQPELLADDREDEVVECVRDEEPAGHAALAEPRTEDAAEAERQQALDGVVAAPSGSDQGLSQTRMRSIW